MNNINNFLPKSKCTGCAACFNRCNMEAIQMLEDNTGFLFPVVEESKCINCAACIRVCPALKKVEEVNGEPKMFIAQNKDELIRRQSTSGGAFTAIAEQVIALGGVVFGAAFRDNYYIAHTEIRENNELEKLRGSKYVQSEIGDTFRKAENYLKKGKWVCFSGTPCQIQGLLKYLGKNYEQLITVDVMCRAVPSPKIFHKYLEYQREKYPSIDKVVFRDKVQGYSYSQLGLYSENESEKPIYQNGSEIDPWLRLFLGGYCNRESCFQCQFQCGMRPSDITLWDCWDTHVLAQELDDNKGTTSIIAWTKKGLKFIENSDLRWKSISEEQLPIKLKRDELKKADINFREFYKDSEKLSAADFLNKYVSITWKIRIKHLGRLIMYRLHIHDIIRQWVHKIRRKKADLFR